MNKLNWQGSFSSKFHKSWHPFMEKIITSPEMWELFQFFKQENAKPGVKLTPESGNLFNSFKIDLNKLSIVLMGQDVYPQYSNGIYISNGVAFCCGNTKKLQPSLEKIYEGILDDCYKDFDRKADLFKLPELSMMTQQGIMLTNAALNCPVGKPGEYFERWKPFWTMVFKDVFELYPGLVFILMGKNAQFYEGCTLPFGHHVLQCEHPAAACYANREFQHNNVFSKAKQLVYDYNKKQINWMSDIPF